MDTSLKARFTSLNVSRMTQLETARRCAALTIPSILPNDGDTENTLLEYPWQSLGAQAVNNLTAKLMLVLFPPNDSFFRMSISDFDLAKFSEQSGQDAGIQESLVKLEKSILDEFETLRLRTTISPAMLSCVTTGAGLLYIPDDGPSKQFRRDKFVVVRNAEGTVIEIMTYEQVSFSSLDAEDQELVQGKLGHTESIKSIREDKKSLDLFTRCVRRDNRMWDFSQELHGIPLEDSKGSFPEEGNPFIPIRWTSMVGSEEGRGHVELNLGDFRTYEALTQAITEGSAAAAKLLFLVDPSSVTKAHDLAKAPNGGFVPGRDTDVTTLKLDKIADFQVAQAQLQTLEQRIKLAFLMNSSIQRNAERVTAEEIRYMANELESAFGGIYSAFATELQLPLLKRIMYRLSKSGRFPTLPPDVKPKITTGLEGLGRNVELSKLQAFKSMVGDTPEAVSTIRWNEFNRRAAVHLTLDPEGLIKTDEELAYEQQQQMQAQLASQVLPEAVKQGATPQE